MRKTSTIFVSLLVLALIAACASVPITGRRQLQLVPAETLLTMSQDQYSQFLAQTKLSDDKEMVQMVNEVGKDIARAVESYLKENDLEDEIANYEWEFNLVDDDESINAFAMPGGKIVVFTGIMPVARNRDGLAVIMGHEIAHVVANHGNERVSQGLLTQLGGVALATALRDRPGATQQLFMAAYGAGAQIGVLLPYSRMHESEADHLGLIFMAIAGYDPKEAPRFWERMATAKPGAQPPEFLSTHPADSRRIRNLEKLLPEAMEYYERSADERG
jgi:predicted Zn-dependent protease